MSKTRKILQNKDRIVSILRKSENTSVALTKIEEELNLSVGKSLLGKVLKKSGFGSLRDYLNKEEDKKIEFEDKKLSTFNLSEWFNHIEQRQNLEQKLTPFQNNAKINIKSNKPIAITFSSDWHLGSLGCDYKAFKRDIDFLMETKDLYIISIGDEIDNFVRFKNVAPMLEQAIPPRVQKIFLMKLAEEFAKRDKILAMGWGNHSTEFDEKANGSSMMSYLIAQNIVFLNGAGIILLKVNDIEYSILVNHKDRLSSYSNPNHGGRKWHEIEFPADIVATGHTHNPAFQWQKRYNRAVELGKDFGGDCLFIKTGTYKTKDVFSERHFSKGVISTPTVVFFPDTKLMVPFKNAQLAMQFIKGCK